MFLFTYFLVSNIFMQVKWAILFMYLTKSLAEELGSCFRSTNDISCEKNRVNILGDFYECKVLQSFETLPSRLLYEDGNIFLKVGDKKLIYDLGTNDTTTTDYRFPCSVKVIEFIDIIFTGGKEKATANLADKNEDMIINSTQNMSDDQIDLYSKSKILFILSHFLKESNKKKLVTYMLLILKMSLKNHFRRSRFVHPKKNFLL